VLLLCPELGRVVIVDDLEGLPPVCKVPWVDADLLKGLCHHQCNGRLKVNVRHQWDIIAAPAHIGSLGFSPFRSQAHRQAGKRRSASARLPGVMGIFTKASAMVSATIMATLDWK